MVSTQSTHHTGSIPPACYVDPIPDISGIGIRLASITPTLLSLALTLIWCYVRHNPSLEALRLRLENTLLYLNTIQIVSAVVILSVLWQVRNELDFFHMRFGFDLAGFAAWASVFTFIAYPGYARKFLLVAPLLLVFIVMGTLVLVHFVNVLGVASRDMGCMPLHYYYQYKAGSITIVVFMMTVFLVFGFFNDPDSGSKRSTTKWKTRWVLLALVLPVVGLILEVVWHFLDYNDLRHLLKGSEDGWSFAQRLQVGLVFGAVLFSMWVGMELDSQFFPSLEMSRRG